MSIPDPPTNLSTTPGNQVINFTFTPGNTYGYTITIFTIRYRTPPNTGGWISYGLGGTFTQYVPVTDTILNLAAATLYEIQVATSTSQGMSQYSQSVLGYTNGYNPGPVTNPTNLTAVASDGGTVSLSWNASTPPPVISYTLQYKVGGFGDWMNLYVGPAISYTVANFESVAVVNNSITYCFQVYATNSVGNSAPSNIAEAMPFNNDLPTRLWARFEPNCPSFKIEANSIANTSYDMQRKSSVLQCPLNGRLNFTKAMLWSMASRNELTRQKAWASQTDSNTYPNITNISDTVGVGLRQVNNTLTCWNPVSPIICTSTTASNVPGNPAILCFNAEAPFNNYRNPKTYAAGNTKWPMFSTK